MLTTSSPTSTPAIASLEHCIALVVEPDQAVAEVLASMLESEGAEVQIASDLSTALEVLPQVEPDLLLCNLKLPDGGGYSLLQHAQQLQRSAPQPLSAIAIAPSPCSLNREKGLAAGVHQYVFEPLDYSALMSTIAQVLQRRDRHPSG